MLRLKAYRFSDHWYAKLSRHLLISISMVCFSVSAIAAHSDDVSEKISKINQEMQKLNEEMAAERKKQSAVQEELREHDLAITELNKKIQNIDKEIAAQKKELEREQANEKKLNENIQLRREHLGKSLRALHATGQQPDMKILFNQDDMIEIQRLMTYYQYFNEALQKEIRELNEQVEKQRQLREKIEIAKAALESEKEAQKKQQKALTNEREERKKLLASIQKNINTKDKAFKELAASEKELQQVLGTTQGPNIANNWPPVVGTFDKQRGKLPWPTVGKVRHPFGSYRAGGQSRYNGMVISAPEGQTVYAVAPGRVVYANWLRGLGLLVIIDHGSNYMSLYAHNDMLYTSVGSKVKDGEPIGTVGTTGGLSQPGLYFEIRHEGKAINPQPWLVPRKN